MNVTITMSRTAWELVAKSNPSSSENYTPEGIEIFNAWQPILQAAAGEKPDALDRAAQ